MSEHDSALRLARSRVMPQVPELAPQLITDPTIIRETLAAEARNEGATQLSEIALNKAERHTIAGFLIGEFATTLVTGEGREARYRQFPESEKNLRAARKRRKKFFDDMREVHREGAGVVGLMYSGSAVPSFNWFLLAEERYAELALQADKVLPKGEVTAEGGSLYAAISSETLSTAALIYFAMLRLHTKSGPVRHQAALDLTPILTGWSARHVNDFARINAVEFLFGTRVKHNKQTDKYQLAYRLPNGKRRVFPSSTGHISPTLKCPAHATTHEQRNEGKRPSTPLENLAYAVVNEAIKRDVL